jgi:hypothetical protein
MDGRPRSYFDVGVSEQVAQSTQPARSFLRQKNCQLTKKISLQRVIQLQRQRFQVLAIIHQVPGSRVSCLAASARDPRLQLFHARGLSGLDLFGHALDQLRRNRGCREQLAACDA